MAVREPSRAVPPPSASVRPAPGEAPVARAARATRRSAGPSNTLSETVIGSYRADLDRTGQTPRDGPVCCKQRSDPPRADPGLPDSAVQTALAGPHGDTTGYSAARSVTGAGTSVIQPDVVHSARSPAD